MIEDLSQFDAPVVDRSTCERLFGVGRRQAAKLMQRFGAYQVGNTLVIDRAVLLERLRAVENDDNTAVEHYRRERLTARLNEVQQIRAARRIQIPVAPDVHDRCVPDLPVGISIEVGRLVIEFAGAIELLSKLYELSQAVANDFDGFRARAEGG